MRRPSVYTDRRGPLDVKMTPMIDVVFLLLIFFIWTSSFSVVEYALQSNVSDATAGAATDTPAKPPEEIDFHDVVVRIVWIEGQPGWSINDEAIQGLGELRQRLTAVFQANEAAPVIIHPDPETPLNHVIAVYDISRLIGFEKVNLAAEDA
jgi:biopolymer transport protein ExbD